MIKNYKPLVSVILPFYNDKHFLKDAIESVICQTYNNWELLLVNDGSSDGSDLIAENYLAEFPGKIRYLVHPNHENKGLPMTRNLGLSASTGDLIALLDADDVWLECKLEMQVRILCDNPAVTWTCEGSTYWNSWNDPRQKDTPVLVGIAGNRTYHPPALALHLYPLGTGPSPCPSAIVFRKDALVAHGGFVEAFAEKKQFYEDQAFLSKFYLNEVVFVSSACNNLYRLRPDSMMHSSIAMGYYNNVRGYFLQWLSQYIRDKNIRFPEVRRKVKWAHLQNKFEFATTRIAALKRAISTRKFRISLAEIK